MKQKDLALIGLVVVISAIVSFIISNTFISPPKNRQTKVEIVDAIVAETSLSQQLPAKGFQSEAAWSLIATFRKPGISGLFDERLLGLFSGKFGTSRLLDTDHGE